MKFIKSWQSFDFCYTQIPNSTLPYYKTKIYLALKLNSKVTLDVMTCLIILILVAYTFNNYTVLTFTLPNRTNYVLSNKFYESIYSFVMNYQGWNFFYYFINTWLIN